MAAKKSFYFKLSRQAEQHLNRIVSLTGVNKTAIVEMAIIKLSDSIKGDDIMNDDTDATYLGGDEMRALYEELAAAEINLEDCDYGV